mmetsp:Transcript_154282/g.493521  ORF Transcript_154282/g.493521 Transcript_154282/m.493521 type:complete len:154 (-) Transcript_154282:619-1080(-)
METGKMIFAPNLNRFTRNRSCSGHLKSEPVKASRGTWGPLRKACAFILEASFPDGTCVLDSIVVVLIICNICLTVSKTNIHAECRMRGVSHDDCDDGWAQFVNLVLLGIYTGTWSAFVRESEGCSDFQARRAHSCFWLAGIRSLDRGHTHLDA